jgi:hypothetical protein
VQAILVTAVPLGGPDTSSVSVWERPRTSPILFNDWQIFATMVESLREHNVGHWFSHCREMYLTGTTVLKLFFFAVAFGGNFVGHLARLGCHRTRLAFSEECSWVWSPPFPCTPDEGSGFCSRNDYFYKYVPNGGRFVRLIVSSSVSPNNMWSAFFNVITALHVTRIFTSCYTIFYQNFVRNSFFFFFAYVL